jgi:cyclic-di-GMP-binding protein
LQQGISTEKGKEIVKAIKNGGFKKVQAQIQDDQVRVQSASIDELQGVIAFLKKEDFGLELQFGNFRS